MTLAVYISMISQKISYKSDKKQFENFFSPIRLAKEEEKIRFNQNLIDKDKDKEVSDNLRIPMK